MSDCGDTIISQNNLLQSASLDVIRIQNLMFVLYPSLSLHQEELCLKFPIVKKSSDALIPTFPLVAICE